MPPLTKIGLRVLLEKGRLLDGDAGVLLKRVLYIKETGRQVCDRRCRYERRIRPALCSSYHEFVRLVEPANDSPSAIVGPVCESGDFFAQDRPKPELHPADLLAIMSTSAYGFVMASNYNSRRVPAEAFVRGRKVELIRRRQSLEASISDEIEPGF